MTAAPTANPAIAVIPAVAVQGAFLRAVAADVGDVGLMIGALAILAGLILSVCAVVGWVVERPSKAGPHPRPKADPGGPLAPRWWEQIKGWEDDERTKTPKGGEPRP